VKNRRKMMAKKKANKKNPKICNICGLPEPHTKEAQVYECFGHIGIKPHLWNLHPEYELFKV